MSWGAINILMVSLIYDKRVIPIYGEILDKKGSGNLEEQQGKKIKDMGIKKYVTRPYFF
ncbi:Genome sequencing data, contig C325 (fragment) [Microcystis aeruginosa PCC 9432]|jgi:hypothetical protein|uniref:Uncharacterized protein n=5 Tax=Microcystis aeruginosa TaxID=1126 RepID=S3J5Q5_MICAE